jgi:hypothetical protein
LFRRKAKFIEICWQSFGFLQRRPQFTLLLFSSGSSSYRLRENEMLRLFSGLLNYAILSFLWAGAAASFFGKNILFCAMIL